MRAIRCWAAWRPLAARLLQGKHKAVYTPFMDTRRPRGGRQCRDGEADRPKGRAEDLPPRTAATRAACARSAPSVVRQKAPVRLVEEAVRGHAAQDEAGRRDVPETQGVRGRRSPARRSETVVDRGRVNVALTQYLRHRPSQDIAPLACISGPGTGSHHRQPPRRSTQFFPTEALRTQIQQAVRGDRDRRAATTCWRR